MFTRCPHASSEVICDKTEASCEYCPVAGNDMYRQGAAVYACKRCGKKYFSNKEIGFCPICYEVVNVSRKTPL